MKTIHINGKQFYYGASVPGLKLLRPAENDTIANGIYLASDKNVAIAYAKRRSRLGGQPTIYTIDINSAKFVDLTDIGTLREVMQGFVKVLRQQESTKWFAQKVITDAIDAIMRDGYTVRNIRVITYSHTKLFTDYLKNLGFDGAVALEGGEGDDVGNHDSWIVFDSNKTIILSEEKI